MTGGDAWAYTMIVLVTCLSIWAGIVGVTLLTPDRCESAARLLARAPGKCIGLGAIVGGVGIALGLRMMNERPAPVKIAGILLILAVVLAAFPGSAGLARVAARRANSNHGAEPDLRATGRAAGLLVLASLAPGVGWFLVFPLQFFASVGAGIRVLRKRPPEPAA
ncbi:MAG: hypothetical protein ACKO5K_11420 [Armatimonadota bacterium]